MLYFFTASDGQAVADSQWDPARAQQSYNTFSLFIDNLAIQAGMTQWQEATWTVCWDCRLSIELTSSNNLGAGQWNLEVGQTAGTVSS